MRSKACKKAQQLLWLPVLCLLLFFVLFTTGCSPSGQEENKLTATQVPTVTQAGELTATPAEKGKIDFILSDMREIYYYTVNSDTFETEAVSAMVESGFTDDPNELILLICDSLEDAGYEIGIKSAVIDGENVVVDFYSGTCPVTGLVRDEEKAVLDAIAQSLLDNLAEQSGVVFQVMGEAYESENFSFGRYYVYMKNHHK